MFELHKGLNYYLCQFPINMNYGIRGLSNFVQSNVPIDILSNSVFVFFNKSRTKVKILRWDGDGFLLYYKVLQKGTFELPSYSDTSGTYELSWDTFSFIMRGVSLESVKLRKRLKI